MKAKFTLICEAGVYEADTFFSMVIEVLRHRCWHLWKHKKWMD